VELETKKVSRLGLDLTRSLSIQQSLYWHDCRSTPVLDQELQEFRRMGGGELLAALAGLLPLRGY